MAAPQRESKSKPADSAGENPGDDTGDVVGSIPEPLPRVAIIDTDAFTIPGEASHWRAYRIIGQRREQLSFAETGDAAAYKEWSIVTDEGGISFSLSELRRRWGTGDFRVQWITRHNNKPYMCGNPVDVTILPEAQVHKGVAPQRAQDLVQPAIVAPAGIGPTSDGFQFFQGFMGVFMHALNAIEVRAANTIAMDRERMARDHDERVSRDREVYAVHQRSMELQIENQRRESKDSRASLLDVIARQNEQIEKLMAILEPGEEEEEEQAPDAQAIAASPPAVPVVEATAVPVSEPDMMGRVVDATNAVGGVIEKLGTVLNVADGLAKTAQGFMQKSADGPSVTTPAS